MVVFADSDGTVYASVDQFVTKKCQEKFDCNNDGLARLIMRTTDFDELSRLKDQVRFFRPDRWDGGLEHANIHRAHDLIAADYLGKIR